MPVATAAAERTALDCWDDALTMRLVVSLVADELGRSRGRAVPAQEWGDWTTATTVDEEGVGADSLARLEIVTRVNQFFRLHVVGAEDYLLVRRSLGEWVEIVAHCLRRGDGALTFETSGSTGAPKRVTHSLDVLAVECDGHAALTPGVGRTLAWTPPHHIYGFLFGAYGPARRGVATLDARAFSPARVAATARAGDMIVATPFLWSLLARSGAELPPDVVGVSSTAPTPPGLWAELKGLGLGRLIEIYGSTETGGLGWRDDPESAFAPLPHVSLDGATLRRRLDGAALDPQDRIALRPGGFAPIGRLDGAVQVGGVNVHPERVRAVLREHPWVADCAVRRDGEGAAARLKAFVVPADGAEAGALADALSAHCAARLSAPERPGSWRFGPALPVCPMGKPADWG